MVDWHIGQRVDEIRRQSKPLAQAISPPAMRRWCLVNVQRYREDDAGKRIEDLGYLVYVPRYKLTVRDKRKHRAWRDTVAPLFAGYLFASVAPNLDPWGDVERVRGVVAIMRMGDKPGYVPADLIDQLRLWEPDNFGMPYRTIEASPVPYEPGELLRVTEGAFISFTVLFLQRLPDLDGEARIVALLDLFGRSNRVTLLASQVERAD